MTRKPKSKRAEVFNCPGPSPLTIAPPLATHREIPLRERLAAFKATKRRPAS